MKKNLFYTFMFSICFGVAAQTPTENYVKTITYTAPSTGTITENDTIVSVTYFDGLGRPKQIVNVRAGGGGEDIVTPITYDPFGRQTRQYLPYAAPTQNGQLHLDPLAQVEAFFNVPKYENTTNPYSEKILENSPLNRVLKQGAPGNPWMADPISNNDRSIKFEYSTNTTSEARLYKVATTTDSYNLGLATFVPTLQESGFYLPGRLYKTIIKDENWQPGDSLLHTTEEFKDFQGRVVLKRTYADMPGEPQTAHDTYYVYDMFNNLSYVIPPKVDTSDEVSPEELNELCYQYVYDHRNRVVEKQLPGKGREYIVYNKGDYPVFTQDQNLSNQGKWMFTKYDHFGRALYTGLFASTASREDLQTTLEGHSPIYESKSDTPTLIDGTDVYYSNNAFPNTGLELLTIHYYDTYNFDLDGGTSEDAYEISPSDMTKTLNTGSKVKVIGTDQWITTVLYYDKKARPIYIYTKNPYLNTVNKVKHKVDFVGKVLETTTVHTKDAQADITSTEKFTYDRMGRLLRHSHQLAGQPEETLTENVYDELGKLAQKKVGNNPASPLQTVDYSYNIRGWLTTINDVNNPGNDLFAFDIRYTNPTTGTPLYNGNISQTRWRTSNTDNSPKNYTYSYDPLNRITQAIDNSGNYNLNGVTYDKNGNILSLNRQGHINEAADNFGVMDDLVYTYDIGNKLIKVDELANALYGFRDKESDVDYSYDDNGNMIADTNKDITGIAYNHLNLPTQVTIDGQDILYIYDATGIKQRKVAGATTTDYAGAYIYENGSLKFIGHTEGYIEPDGAGGYDYVYQYKDHLGNVRLSYSDSNDNGTIDAGTEILHERNYYPFGMLHSGYNNSVQGVVNTHKQYQGQETDTDFDLNWHHFKYRTYDAAIGRFLQIDPLAPAYAYNATYAFAENNVVSGIDLEGKELSFELDGNRATGVSGPRQGTYTLQEVRSIMSKKKAARDAARKIIDDKTPKTAPSQGEINYPTSHINRAKYIYPQSGLRLAETVGVGAKEAVQDVFLGGAFAGIYKAFRGAKSVWNLNKFQRGRVIEQMLGSGKSGLASNFPVIDKIEDGVAVSIKSMDLTAKSYQSGNRVFNTLKGYIDKLDGFTNAKWGGVNIQEGKSYTSKALELAVQTGKGTQGQWGQIQKAVQYALSKDINVTIRFID
ncbi:MAG: DUF6443 domain-containing protein [Bacteroidota bacterium]